jgi:putative restriction endonuclease
MGFGVFIHRSDSIYDDSPSERYQFPSQYLGRARAYIGSWIIYYEPTKAVESRGYFALAKVERIIPDPCVPNMHLALIEPGTYLDFPCPVPFKLSGELVETGLSNPEGKISGRAQAAVRPINSSDFDRIVELGLEDGLVLMPRSGGEILHPGFEDNPTPFEHELERDRVRYLGSRIVRDRVFRRVVLQAYGERCAVTGLKLINGGGRAEVEAAHIRPVEANGPDTITNGVALSGTAHWMFDRGLISFSDDMEILVSRHANDVDSIRSLINKSGFAIAPRRAVERPDLIGSLCNGTARIALRLRSP